MNNQGVITLSTYLFFSSAVSTQWPRARFNDASKAATEMAVNCWSTYNHLQCAWNIFPAQTQTVKNVKLFFNDERVTLIFKVYLGATSPVWIHTLWRLTKPAGGAKQLDGKCRLWATFTGKYWGYSYLLGNTTIQQPLYLGNAAIKPHLAKQLQIAS